MNASPQPIQPGFQQPIPQLAPGQTVAQQYVVTINGDISGLHPPINVRAIGITATIQLICTVLIILLGVLAILVGCVLSMDGMPIWSGLCFYMVAGILGRVAVRKKNNCSVIAYMVLSILSALASASLMLSQLEAIFIESESDILYFKPPIDASIGGRIAVDGAIMVLALIEMVVAIVASAFCCRGTCCAPSNPLQVQYSPALPAGMVVLPQAQGQPLLINPTPPASYEAGPLPDKNALVIQPQGTMVQIPPPQAASQGEPAVNGSADAVGHDIAADDGTDQQPLVM